MRARFWVVVFPLLASLQDVFRTCVASVHYHEPLINLNGLCILQVYRFSALSNYSQFHTSTSPAHLSSHQHLHPRSSPRSFHRPPKTRPQALTTASSLINQTFAPPLLPLSTSALLTSSRRTSTSESPFPRPPRTASWAQVEHRSINMSSSNLQHLAFHNLRS